MFTIGFSFKKTIILSIQDPDFQGDPINNMNNTNLDGGGREGDWAGIMSRLNTVAIHLSLVPKLTRNNIFSFNFKHNLPTIKYKLA